MKLCFAFFIFLFSLFVSSSISTELGKIYFLAKIKIKHLILKENIIAK